jgi:hypothetical protein
MVALTLQQQQPTTTNNTHYFPISPLLPLPPILHFYSTLLQHMNALELKGSALMYLHCSVFLTRRGAVAQNSSNTRAGKKCSLG